MSAASMITNCWGEATPILLEPEHTTIFSGKPGAAYNHHPQITSLNGRLYATWSQADTHEDEPGQRMLLATSDDEGRTWANPIVLVDRQPGAYGDGIVTAMGIHVYQETLVAYYGYYDYTARGRQLYYDDPKHLANRADPHGTFHAGTYTGAMQSSDAGATWTRAHLHIPRFVPNLCPQPLRSGRLVMPGNMRCVYTDDPRGLTGWTNSQLPRLPPDYCDDPEGFWKGKHARGDSEMHCEGSLFQTDDGIVHLMLRTESGYLATATSADDGVTWSEPQPTAFSDGSARHHFGRLADGRYIGMNCPTAGNLRTPLVIALSEDGVIFDKHYIVGREAATGPRMPGFHKHGRYGYPSYHCNESHMYIIYSIHKEDIACCRVPLAAFV